LSLSFIIFLLFAIRRRRTYAVDMHLLKQETNNIPPVKFVQEPTDVAGYTLRVVII